MPSKVNKAWTVIRDCLIQIADTNDNLSEKEKDAVEKLMNEWMDDNPRV